MEIINKRRSVRQFLDKKVEKEKIESILKAAMQAPSAGNQQPWEFAVVEDKENIEKLSISSPYAKFSNKAPLLIIVYLRNKELKHDAYVQQDLGACIENMLLESTSLNLGSTWMGIYPDKNRVEYIKNLFNLEDTLVPFSIIAFGYPKNKDANKFIDRYDEKRVHYIK